MKSIQDVYKIGRGPSSSHTMGPERAAMIFAADNPDLTSVKVVLYGSLAKTGVGHHTDKAVQSAFPKIPVEVVFDETTRDLPHENTLDFIGSFADKPSVTMRAMSIGGGDIVIPGREREEMPDVYPESSFSEIASFCKKNNLRISDYVYLYEPNIRKYLYTVWYAMKDCIEKGIAASGELEGGLHVERKAQFLYQQRHIDETEITRENRTVCAYAFAVGEQNASGETIVTAPTCGAASVLPSVMKYMQEKKGFHDEKILDALAVGGLIGQLVKTNASVSGAECGCQAEIGTACSMTAAALAELFEMGIDQIEYAAEVAMEHHLGLTCDPIHGLVQIPCIERGAVAAMRAINALNLANFLSSTRKISFDLVVETMYETGKDLKLSYRETSEGGLAKLYQ